MRCIKITSLPQKRRNLGSTNLTQGHFFCGLFSLVKNHLLLWNYQFFRETGLHFRSKGDTKAKNGPAQCQDCLFKLKWTFNTFLRWIHIISRICVKHVFKFRVKYRVTNLEAPDITSWSSLWIWISAIHTKLCCYLLEPVSNVSCKLTPVVLPII